MKLALKKDTKSEEEVTSARVRSETLKHFFKVLMDIDDINTNPLCKALNKQNIKSLKSLLSMSMQFVESIRYENNDGTSVSIPECDLVRIKHLRSWVQEFMSKHGEIPSLGDFTSLTADALDDYILKSALLEPISSQGEARLTLNPAIITAGVNVAELLGLGESLGYIVEKATQLADNNSGRVKEKVEDFKHEYGNGISSLITLKNNSAFRLQFRGTHSNAGHFWKFPAPCTLDAGSDSCFLHVHSTGAASGSEGYVLFELEIYDIAVKAWRVTQHSVKFSWKTPYWGENHASVEGDKIVIRDTGTSYDGSMVQVRGTVGGTSSPMYEFSISQALVD